MRPAAKLIPPKPDRPAVHGDLPCPHCGYNLRGLVRRRCPECGVSFSPRRARSGHLQRSEPRFWRMFVFALARPTTFWSDEARYLSARQPLWFCLTVSVITAIATATAVTIAQAIQQSWSIAFSIVSGTMIALTGIIPFLALAALIAGIGFLATRVRGLAGDGAGWRSAAAAAVWFPGWGILIALLYLDVGRPIVAAAGLLPRPDLPAWAPIAGMFLATLTFVYSAMAMYQEERSEAE